MISTPTSLEFRNPRGFVVVEGVNGGGKSTLIAGLAKRFAYANPLLTREPGATALGKKLRALLLEDTCQEKICSKAELLLFSADRSEHVEKLILPALQQKRLVISDRYHYSTTAFQGYGRGLDLGEIRTINSIATGALTPDLVILLDLDPATGLARAGARAGAGSDSFEAEELAFHQRLRQGFLSMARELPELFLLLDANQRPEALLEEASNALQPLLSRLFPQE
jgi:dTMP kinase